MPRAKNLQHYPARYAEILRDCALRGVVVEVALPTLAKGNSLRGHWYAYIGALKAEAARRASASAVPTVGDLDIIELNAQAPMTMIQVVAQADGSCKVVWQNREKSWQALAVGTATVTSGDSRPTATGPEDAAQRLLRIQQEMGDEHK